MYQKLVLTLLFSLVSINQVIAADEMAISYQNTEKMTTEQKLTSAAQLMAQMKTATDTVLSMLQEAHKAKDIIKINFINDKLSTIKGLFRIAEESDIALKEAAITAQADLINHEYTKIYMASEKIQVILTQLQAMLNQTSVNSATSQSTANVEVFDAAISAYQPVTSDQDLALLPVLSSERPEAVSANQ
jgi:hypothetical protein